MTDPVDPKKLFTPRRFSLPFPSETILWGKPARKRKPAKYRATQEDVDDVKAIMTELDDDRALLRSLGIKP